MNKQFIIKWFFVVIILISGLSVFIGNTQNQFPVTPDERIYFETARSFVEWIRNTDFKSLFRSDVVAVYWDISHEHPSILKIISGISWHLGRKTWGDLAALRAATLFMLSFFLAVWVAVIMKVRGALFAGTSCLIFLLHPHIFGYCHLAEITIQLTCLWGVILGLLYLGAQQESPAGTTIASGILWGLAVAAKVTSLLLIVVGGLYLGWKRPKYLVSFVVLWCVCGAVSFIASWPVLWTEGISYFIDHIRHFHSLNVIETTYYDGNFYARLPWHYPWAMFLLTMPAYLIPFLFFGTYRVLKNRDDLGVLGIINAIVVLGGLSLYAEYPGDGIRHFLMIYPAVGYVTAYGMIKRSTPRLHALFVFLVIFALMVENILVFPDGFKYYNAFIGRGDGVLRWGLREQYYP